MNALSDLWAALKGAGADAPCLLLDCAGIEDGQAGIPASAFTQLRCLFSGELAEGLADVAPYLGQFAALDDTCRSVAEDLLLAQTAILVVPRGGGAGFGGLYRHFRKFNVAYDPQGQPLFFRYYDPRVMLDLLRTVEGERLRPMFDPVQMLVLAAGTSGFVQAVRTDAGLRLDGQ